MGEIDEYIKLNKRKCSVLTVGGFRPTYDPLASNFALAPVAKSNEEWPTCDGKPLTYICQLNLTEAPYLPEQLKDIAVITFYIDLEKYLSGRNNENSWCLRVYKSLDGLVKLVPPKEAIKHKGFECRWEFYEEDYPVYDDPDLIRPSEMSDEEFDRIMEEDFNNNVKRTKVGGWASNIQHEQWWGYNKHPANPEFCMQINSEEKVHLNWVDSGTVYIARGTSKGHEEEWFIDIQFY
ncbi:MAG: DUF1963 domain-containing protein [Bacillota bacterium]